MYRFVANSMIPQIKKQKNKHINAHGQAKKNLKTLGGQGFRGLELMTGLEPVTC